MHNFLPPCFLDIRAEDCGLEAVFYVDPLDAAGEVLGLSHQLRVSPFVETDFKGIDSRECIDYLLLKALKLRPKKRLPSVTRLFIARNFFVKSSGSSGFL